MSEDILQRLKNINKAIDDAKEQKTRLEVSLENAEKRKEELESECKEKFGVDIEKLGDKIVEYKLDIEKKISDAEKILGR
jgi:phage shock protein A